MSKGNCQFCGKEQNNLKQHERLCSKNPNRDNLKDSNEGKIEEPEKTEPEDKAQDPERKPLIITDLIQYQDKDGIVAWFMEQNGNKIYREPLAIGLLNGEFDTVPCVLILSQDGTLLPPFMIGGFIGLFPKDQIFPDNCCVQEEIKTEPPEPIKEPGIALSEPDKSIPVNEDRHILPPEEPPEEPPKKFLGIFPRKGKIKEPVEVSSDTKDLVKKIVDASK